MALELIYTSAQRGLRPGTRGFCTVAYSKGMSPACVRFLEALSSYKGIYTDNDPRAADNPTAFSHYRCIIEGRSWNVVSRIGPSGADHTNRGNKLAHHLLLSRREQIPAGPAMLAAAPGLFRGSWAEVPRILEEPPLLPLANLETSAPAAGAWKQLTGDQGWAGVLAFQFLRAPQKPVFIVFEPGMPLLQLLCEALELLEPEKRWQVTFSTFFQSLPAGVSCLWRCCPLAAPALRDARRLPGNFIIDLTAMPGNCPETPLTELAREKLAESPHEVISALNSEL